MKKESYPQLIKPLFSNGNTHQIRSRLPGVLKTRNGDSCIHDEILLEAPIETTDEVVLILKETMEEAGRVLLKTIPVEAEVVVVGSWAEK